MALVNKGRKWKILSFKKMSKYGSCELFHKFALSNIYQKYFSINYQLWKTSQTRAAVYLPKYTKSIEAALWECQRIGTRTEPLLEAGGAIIINTIILYQIKIKK